MWSIRGIASKAVILAILATCTGALLAYQDSPTYAEEYDLYEKAEAETDLAKREALLIQFVQTFKESVLDPNVSYLYSQSYKGLEQAGRWRQLASQAEKFLRHRPDDAAAIQAATAAYQQLGETQKLVSFGSKLYGEAPSATTALLVAKAYKSLNDRANFRTWAERTVRHDPNNWQMLVELSNSYWAANDFAKASDYAGRALQAADKAQKPQGQSDAQWNAQLGQVRGFCYRAIGEAAYVNKNMGGALKNFEEAVKQDVKNDFGHYRLGLIYWQTGKTQQAILSLARSFVLNGPSSKEARDQLNQLYKSTHGTIDGLPAVIQGARRDVGL